MSSRKVTPTEYRGVAFDSKSEAVFARVLDLLSVRWERCHPIKHAEHEWDFLLWKKAFCTFTSVSDGFDDNREPLGNVLTYHSLGSISPVLVELKPSEPTESYLRKLSKHLIDPWNREHRLVVWGNPFEPPFECDLYDFGYYRYRELNRLTGEWSDERPLFYCLEMRGDYEAVQEALSYRFDLKEQLDA